MKPDNTLIRQNGELAAQSNASSSACAQKRSRPAAPRRIEWSKQTGRLTRMGGLSYFATFLESTGLFTDLVERCPLCYSSNNAPNKRDILGAILLAVLEGHTRYAHMASLAKASLDAEVLGMEKIPSEDSVRAALRKLTQTKEQAEKTCRWLDQCFDQLCKGCLHMPWVLDVDVTVKLLYGRQEGAVVGYNPGSKPGRPSHAYHSFWGGHLRLCLCVQVRPGNETAGSYGLQPFMQWLERMPREVWPSFVRGDIGYGTQVWMSDLEAKGLPYLFKLKRSARVKELIALCELNYLNESEALSEKVGDDRGLGTALYNAHEIYLGQGRKEEAEAVLERAIVAFRRAESTGERFLATGVLARLCFDRGDTERADNLIAELKAGLAKGPGDDERLHVGAVMEYARLLQRCGSAGEAEEALAGILPLAEKLALRPEIVQILEARAEWAGERGDHALAADLLRQTLAAERDLHRQQSEEALRKQQVSMDVDRLREAAERERAHTLELEKINAALETSRDEAARQAEAARRASEAKGRFLSVMSHELRTPVNAIHGCARLLGEDLPESRRRACLDLVRSASESLVTLVNHQLDLAKIEAGHVRVAKAPFDLAGEIRSALLAVAPAAARQRRQHRPCVRKTGLAIWHDGGSNPIIPSRIDCFINSRWQLQPGTL